MQSHEPIKNKDKNANVENTAVDTVLISDFKKNLSERDMKILEMRMEGYTFQEIANILGYSTHSAVTASYSCRSKTSVIDFISSQIN